MILVPAVIMVQLLSCMERVMLLFLLYLAVADIYADNFNLKQSLMMGAEVLIYPNNGDYSLIFDGVRWILLK